MTDNPAPCPACGSEVKPIAWLRTSMERGKDWEVMSEQQMQRWARTFGDGDIVPVYTIQPPPPSSHVEAAQPVAYRWRWTDSEAWVLTRDKPDHVARVVEPLFTTPPPQTHVAPVDWENADDPVVKLFVGFDVEGYVEEYELAGDDGDSSPNEEEKTLIADAIHGVVFKIHEELRKLIPAQPAPEKHVEGDRYVHVGYQWRARASGNDLWSPWRDGPCPALAPKGTETEERRVFALATKEGQP